MTTTPTQPTPLNPARHKGTFFKILATTPHSQVGTMTIEPGSDSGPEDIHPGDQIIYIIEGTARVVINGKTTTATQGTVLAIPAQAQHHIYNDETSELFFLTIYAPPAY